MFFNFVDELRAAGIRAEAYVGTGKFGDQMKYADKRGAAIAVIEGGDERARGEVTLKDLALGAELAKSVESRAAWVGARQAQGGHDARGRKAVGTNGQKMGRAWARTKPTYSRARLRAASVPVMSRRSSRSWSSRRAPATRASLFLVLPPCRSKMSGRGRSSRRPERGMMLNELVFEVIAVVRLVQRTALRRFEDERGLCKED